MLNLYSDHDGKINGDETCRLVSDLFEARDGSTPQNIVEIANAIKLDINSSLLKSLSQPTTDITSYPIDVDAFVSAAKRRPSPFDHIITGKKGLATTLLQKCDIILKLVSEREAAVSELEGAKRAFIPTYEWQKIEPWHEPLAWRGLEIQMDSKRARIPESMQAVLMIPALDRPVRIWANRTETVRMLYDKISQAWPGLRGRGAVIPSSSTIQLKYNDQKLDEESTVEQVRLYFIAKDVTVEIINGNEKNLQSKAFHDEHSAVVFDRISANLASLQRQTRAETASLIKELDAFHARIQKLYEAVLIEADSIPFRSEIDEVDRLGLRDMAKDLRQRIQMIKFSTEQCRQDMTQVLVS